MQHTTVGVRQQRRKLLEMIVFAENHKQLCYVKHKKLQIKLGHNAMGMKAVVDALCFDVF